MIAVDENHFLVIDGKPVKQRLLPYSRSMKVRRFGVWHFTGGASGDSSIRAMSERGVSAHLVIDRDGSITQCVPFDFQAGHAGGLTGKFSSFWRDPKTDQLFSGNDSGIGIEIANAGSDAGALKWAKKQGFKTEKAKHPNGGPSTEWESYPAAQLNAVLEVSRALVKRYNLDDFTGHDCISSWRKNDPGPAFPLSRMRSDLGFPEVVRIFNSKGQLIKSVVR